MENNKTEENDKLILDEESTEYLNSIKSIIHFKFQDYKKKLLSIEELLLDNFHNKLNEVQTLKNELSNSINKKEQNLINSTQTSKIAEETKLLKETLNSLCHKIEKLEQSKESLNNSNLSDIVEIIKDEFLVKFKIAQSDLNSSIPNDLKSPASKPTRNICRHCRNPLEWNKHFYSNYCNCSNSNEHYKYGCESCDINYCTGCSYPIDITLCGCGKRIERVNVYTNYCDLCRTNINSSCYRCSDCDYDVCDTCYEKNK